MPPGVEQEPQEVTRRRQQYHMPWFYVVKSESLNLTVYHATLIYFTYFVTYSRTYSVTRSLTCLLTSYRSELNTVAAAVTWAY